MRNSWMVRRRMIGNTPPQHHYRKEVMSKETAAFVHLYWTGFSFVPFCFRLFELRYSPGMEKICPMGLIVQRALCFEGSTALMVVCNCSITHTNVHSVPFEKQKHCISSFFHYGPDCQPLSITANRVKPLRSGEQREQCHIHKQRHQLSSSLP